MPLPLSAELREKLRRKRARQLASRNAKFDKFLLNEEVVLLDPGMGPVTYIGLDGRIYIDTSDWTEPTPEKIEETKDPGEIVMALLVGAKKQQIPELLHLLPSSPPNSTPCRLCDGTRWCRFPGADENQQTVVCMKCQGYGWENTATKRRRLVVLSFSQDSSLCDKFIL